MKEPATMVRPAQPFVIEQKTERTRRRLRLHPDTLLLAAAAMTLVWFGAWVQRHVQ